MTIVILESASSALAPLKYSTDKLRGGQVSIVCAGNLPDDLPSTAREAFLERETHPSLSRKARRLAFHVAFNPDSGDTITRGQIPECIREWMEKMGYAGQPYIVFRHNDIEREHHHLVSTNILPNGRIISNSFSQWRSLKAGKELQDRYGFVMGRREKAATPVRTVEELMGQELRFRREAPVREQFTAIIRRAHEFNYESYAQFLAILASFGMMTHAVRRKKGNWGLDAYATDENGNKISRLYAIDRMLRKDIVEEFRSRRDKNRTMEQEANGYDTKMAAAAVRCMDRARSFSEYRSMIRSLGFDIYTFRDGNGILQDVSIVDKKNGRVGSVSIMVPSLTLERLRAVIDFPERKMGTRKATGALTAEQTTVQNKDAQMRSDRMQETEERHTRHI